MKKVYTIFSDTEKKYSLYKASNKYTEQNIKNVYKIAQNWTTYFIKCAVCIEVELNKENVWMKLFQPEYIIFSC